MSANVQAKCCARWKNGRIERLGGDESIPVDVRIISATHRALEEEIGEGNSGRTFSIACACDDRHRSAARAPRRYSGSGDGVCPTVRGTSRLAAEANRTRGAAQTDGIRLARQRARTSQCDRARRDHVEGDELNAIDITDEPTKKTSVTAIDSPVNGDLSVPYTSDFRDDRREFERRYIARCLEESGGNVTRAASVLGMHRQSLQHN